MKISRFFGITNREAMRQVRLALGSEALIVSNRRVNGGVEILATDPTSVSEAEEGAGFATPVRGGVPATTPAPDALGDQPRAEPSVPAQRQGQPQSPSTQPQVQQQSRPPTQHQSPVQGGRPPSSSAALGAYAAAFQAAYGTPASQEQLNPPATTPPASFTQPKPQPQRPVQPQPHPAQSAQQQLQPQSPQQRQTPIHPATSPIQPPARQATPPEPSLSSAIPGLDAPAAGQPGVMDAIGAMRGALESRIDELLWGNQLRRAPQAASLFQTLLNFGFSTALLRAMLQRLPEGLSDRAALQWVRHELVSTLPVPPSEDELWKPGLALALVGPTGVGKTTTIAKLAARCVRRFGPDKLVLITTDTYRIGAHEQLKIYGQMLRAPVHVVRSAEEMRGVVEGIRPDQLILIDNVGISQRDRYIAEQAAMLAAAGRDVTRLLVLNAASHGETLDEVARSYSGDGGTPLKGCIITKVDEATRLGAALDTALRYRLPIHYVSIGQKVPEHLVYLQAAELVDQALTSQPSSRTLYAPTEADLAALMAVAQPADLHKAEDGQSGRKPIQMLPRLLSLAGGKAGRLTAEDLQAGCEFIDELPCTAEAYELWRNHSGGAAAQPDAAARARHMMRVVQNAWAVAGQKHVLAIHDQVSLKAAGEPASQLRATFMLDQHGAPLASPIQQLSQPAGWLSSCGATQTQSPTLAAALVHQVEWLSAQAAELPVMHLFEGGNPALWDQLRQRSLPWMAQVPAITRVHLEDGATTVQALAKTLPHHPVADPDYLFSMTEVAGGPAAERVLWAASTVVHIAVRGRSPFPLHMVSARLVNRVDGKEIRRIIGLHAGLDVSLDTLAAWLVIKAESREATRHTVGAWALSSVAEGAGDPLAQAMFAAQSGLAAWQLTRSPVARAGKELAAGMLGRKVLPTASAPAAAFKLFALKEMLSA